MKTSKKLNSEQIRAIREHLDKVRTNETQGCLCGKGDWKIYEEAVSTPLFLGGPFGPTIPAVLIYCDTCGELRQIVPTAIPIDLTGDQDAGGEAEEVEVLDPVEEENVT